MNLETLPIDIYLDGASLPSNEANLEDPLIKGFTTNPSLARRAGVTDYLQFCKDVAKLTNPKPVSLEVIADDHAEIERQARILADCGPNVFVKVPIMLTDGTNNGPLIKKLGDAGIKVNVTACMGIGEVDFIWNNLSRATPSIVSIFCGRIADTLRPPPYLHKSHGNPMVRFLWASVREPYNLHQAVDNGYSIITMQEDILKKTRKFAGMNLMELSKMTVRGFYEDARICTFEL